MDFLTILDDEVFRQGSINIRESFGWDYVK